MKKITTLLAAALAVGVAVPAFAQSVRVDHSGKPNNMKNIPPREGLNAQDRRTMMDAAISNMFEIESSKLALNRARGAWTKAFARDMIREHKIAHDELRKLAREHRFALPSKLPAPQQAVMARLRKLRGAAFDNAYRMAQIRGHEETSRKLERGIKFGNDSHVRGYAVKMLPAVREHLVMARTRKTMTTDNM